MEGLEQGRVAMISKVHHSAIDGMSGVELIANLYDFEADPEPTRALADFLTAQGYSVWWDTNLTSGEVFREVIDRELAAADAVIVIWTAHSVGP